jgi:hypothetical protein
VVETRFGYHIIKVIGQREGDISEEDAKQEIAERLYREARGTELAQQAATAALAELGGELTMDALRTRLAGEPAVEGEPAIEGEQEAAPADWRRRHTANPSVSESRLFGRGDSVVTGPYNSAPLNAAVFEMAEEGALPDEPMALGEELFVYQLTTRERATREGFTDEVRERLTNGLMRTKSQEVLRAYIARLTEEAQQDGAININSAVLSGGAEDEDGAEDGAEDDPSEEDS